MRLWCSSHSLLVLPLQGHWRLHWHYGTHSGPWSITSPDKCHSWVTFPLEWQGIGPTEHSFGLLFVSKWRWAELSSL
jgi:hypothetical protein